MKKFYNIIFTIFTLTILLLGGCAEKPTPSLFSDVPTGPIGAAPTITSITPAGTALAGVDVITITGTNFLTDPTKDLVYFNGRPANIKSATSTSLVITAPQLLSDTSQSEVGNFEVATLGAELFSNKIQYKLNAAVYQFFSFSQFQKPFDFVLDGSGNIFVSMTDNYNVGQGVKKISPAGVLSDYASKGLETYWITMRFGSSGTMYTAIRNTGGIFQIPAGGGKPSVYKALPNVKAKINSFDFDAANNIWVAGDDTAIYKIKPDKSLATYSFKGNITAVRFFNNSLYAAVKTDSLTKIVSFSIDGNGDLGSAVEYYDYSKDYGAGSVNAIEFATDGTMYLGTSNVNSPVVVVNPNKSTEILFPGTLAQAPALFLGWDSNGYLYYTRGEVLDPATGSPVILQTILRLTVSKQGAPYYGL